MHRLALLEKELLRDNLGKKGGNSGSSRGGTMGISVSLGVRPFGAMVEGRADL